MEPTAGLPGPDVVRAQVARGRPLVLPLDPTLDLPAVMALGQTLQTALPPDVRVIASPPARGRGPVVTVLQLLTDAEAETLRPALERLVAEFRRMAGALVAQLPAGVSRWPGTGPAWPDTVRLADGSTWHVDPHGPHCRFEDDASGVVVDARCDDPDDIDPYFLLVYAETAGRHGAILEACAERFHDMCRLLEFAGIARR